MATNFVFPPPPPPPPVSTQNQTAATYHSQPGNWSSSRGRGRGRGFRGQRGGNRGGYGSTGNTPSNGRGAWNSGYSYQQRNSFTDYNASSNFSTSGRQQCGQTGQSWHPNHSTFSTQSQYSQYHTSNSPLSSQVHEQRSYVPQNPSSKGFSKNLIPNTGPVAMGPPIRMGFKDSQDGAYAASPQQSFARQSFGANSAHYKIDNRPHNVIRGQGQKRQYGEAFHQNDVKSKPTAPAVPSFGAPLTNPVPALKGNVSQPKQKRKRQNNQLGLTPKGEEPEYSDEDLDEEAKLAASLASSKSGDQPLHSFEYRGKLMKLNTPEEIAAWIEERRKRFPTKLKVAEAQERQALRKEQARKVKEQREKDKAAVKQGNKLATLEREKEKKKRRKKTNKPGDRANTATDADEAKKALEEIEETQKRLAELKKKVEKSQKDGFRRKGKSVGSSTHNSESQKFERKRDHAKPTSKNHQPTNNVFLLAHAETPSKSLPAAPYDNSFLSQPGLHLPECSKDISLASTTLNDSDGSVSLPSTNLSDYDLEDEQTSSAGSDSSSSLFDSLDSGSGTDSDSDSSSSSAFSPHSHHSTSSIHCVSPGDRRKPPPKRSQKILCRNFLQYGKCRKRACRFRHQFIDADEASGYVADKRKGRGKSNEPIKWEDRPSLYQRLLKKQIEDEEKEERERNRMKREQEAHGNDQIEKDVKEEV